MILRSVFLIFVFTVSAFADDVKKSHGNFGEDSDSEIPILFFDQDVFNNTLRMNNTIIQREMSDVDTAALMIHEEVYRSTRGNVSLNSSPSDRSATSLIVNDAQFIDQGLDLENEDFSLKVVVTYTKKADHNTIHKYFEAPDKAHVKTYTHKNALPVLRVGYKF